MDIGPGDRVRCVDNGDCGNGSALAAVFLIVGQIYNVEACDIAADDSPVIRLTQVDHHLVAKIAREKGRLHNGFSVSRFRKLPDISEWLETSTEYEEPRRVPAPREVEGV